MRVFAAWILVCVLCVAGGSEVQAARMSDCFSYEKPRISITPFQTPPRLNSEVGLADIRNIYGYANSAYAQAREVPVGVTAASLQIESELEITTRTANDDSLACAQITAVDLRFGFPDTTIYIAHELPTGSCAYQVVLQHEMKHVESDLVFLNEISHAVADDLKLSLHKMGRVRASSPEIAKTHLQKDMDDYTNRLSGLLTELRERRQKDVDTSEEYERISQSCNGDIRRIVNRSGL